MTNRQVSTISWSGAALGVALLSTGHTRLAVCVLVPLLIVGCFWNLRAAKETLDEPK